MTIQDERVESISTQEVTFLWKNMAADGTAVSERKTKLMTTPSQRSISSKSKFFLRRADSD